MKREDGTGMGWRRGVSARRGAALFVAAYGLAGLLVACGSGNAPLAVVDPGAAPLNPTYEQARGILDRYCLPCHGGGGGAREDLPPVASAHGTTNAPEDEGGENIDVSSCAAIHASLTGIMNTSVNGNSMPPGALPRLTEREKLTVARWIAQGACSPCTQCPP